MAEERRRGAFEGTERIESAIAERAFHSKQWLPPNLQSDEWKSRHLSLRAVRTQQLDVKELIAEYQTYYQNATASTSDSSNWELQSLLEEADLLDKNTDSEPAQSLEVRYGRNAHAPGLRRLLCPFTSKVDVDRVYRPAEDYGRLVDLVEFHQLWLTSVAALKIEQVMTYQEYLKRFADLHSTRQQFEEYISRLRSYLESVYERFRPLDRPLMDLSAYRTALSSPTNDPLWCPDCNKLFGSPGVFSAHFEGKKHKRAAAEKNSNTTQTSSASVDVEVVKVLAEILAQEINDTIANINRRSGMTQRERSLESESLEQAIVSEDAYLSDGGDNQNEKKQALLDPAQLYLGLDGKPIPHWLHKLQGLGVDFKCEICGGQIYKGRKEFDRHFRDKRHKEGLACLNIGTPDLYRGLSSIKEVVELRDSRSRHDPAKPDIEVEDDEGNVMSQRVYDDLKRQGIL